MAQAIMMKGEGEDTLRVTLNRASNISDLRFKGMSLNLKKLSFTSRQDIAALNSFFREAPFEEIDFDHSSQTQVRMSEMFRSTPNLKKIIAHDSFRYLSRFDSGFRDSGVQEIDGLFYGDYTEPDMWSDTFYGCSALREIRFANNANENSISFNFSPLLSDNSLVSIANGLSDSASAQTISFNPVSVNRAINMYGIVSNGIFVPNATISNLWAVANAPDQSGMEPYGQGDFSGEGGNNYNYIFGQDGNGNPIYSVSPYGWRGYGLAANANQRAGRVDNTGGVYYNYRGTAGFIVQFRYGDRAISRQIQLEAGKSYTLYFWYKGVSKGFDIKALSQIENTHQSGGNSIITSVSADITRNDNSFSDVTQDVWQNIKVSFTMPNDKSVANIILSEAASTETSDAGFDDFFLFEEEQMNLEQFIIHTKGWIVQ